MSEIEEREPCRRCFRLECTPDGDIYEAGLGLDGPGVATLRCDCTTCHPRKMPEFPQRLVDVTRERLRSEFWPAAGDDDARSLLAALAAVPGVEFPAQPDPVVWNADGSGDICWGEHVRLSVYRWSVSEGDPFPDHLQLAKLVASHLNGECTELFATLVGLVRGYLAMPAPDVELWCSRFSAALDAIEAHDG